MPVIIIPVVVVLIAAYYVISKIITPLFISIAFSKPKDQKLIAR